MEVRIIELEEITLASTPHVGPYDLIGPKFGLLAQWAEGHQMPFEGSIGIWLDDPNKVSEDKLKSIAALIVSKGAVLPEADFSVSLTTIPGGEFAVGRYVGPYTGLDEAWSHLYRQEIPKLGRELAIAPSFERYENSCPEVRPEELITDLYIRLG